MTLLIMIIGYGSAVASLLALGIAGYHAVSEEFCRPKKEG